MRPKLVQTILDIRNGSPLSEGNVILLHQHFLALPAPIERVYVIS